MAHAQSVPAVLAMARDLVLPRQRASALDFHACPAGTASNGSRIRNWLNAMQDERLWAPWRLGYIKDSKTPSADPRPLNLSAGADPGCFLCRGAADTLDRENLIVGRGPRSVVVINRYPYNNGHLLVAPRFHKASLIELDAEEQLELQQQITRYVGLLERHLNAEGFNIGLNLGRVAGAGLPGHLHWHIVPRWSGDTNFMPVVAGIHVIPQSLDELWTQLQAADAADAHGKPTNE